MGSPKDPLLENEATDRTYYATGVLLDTTDFVAEQSYHRGRLARALSALHGIGTASGLSVTYEPHHKVSPDDPTDLAKAKEVGEIVVSPGIAIDPLGRLVEVTTKSCIRVKRWYEGQEPSKLVRRLDEHFNVGPSAVDLPEEGVVADLFLRFRVYERGWTPAMASGLYDATDAVSPARLRDGYELRLVPRGEQGQNPPSVPPSPWPLPDGGKTWPERPEENQDPATRVSDLKKAILSSWHPGRPALLDKLWSSNFLPHELRYENNLPVEDPAWVFLARVVIGVTGNADSSGRSNRTGVVAVDNEMRPFAVTVAALARWLGI
ncbi:hypothetical protein [Archangium lipolyticum]|uniref:hypothetical protein n=1 Tax=Archangium lipolyticum TaxID=2970465 RepID=UPI002149B269|nr:hypothetical protein [Archangium lipolyticum]